MRVRLVTASALLSVNLYLAGCAAPALSIAPPPSATVQALLQQGAQFGATGAVVPSSDEDLLALNEAMRAFVAENVPSVLSPKARLRYLTDSLVSPKALGLTYSPGVTLTAAETFEKREGNCLALTSLFIAMAREANLNAWYNEISVPPSWDMLSENSIAVYKHINAVVELGDEQEIVVDLSVDNYEYQYAQTRVTDTRAAAQYYNNRGVEMLNSNQLQQAYYYFKKALEADPKAGHIWGNLGTLFRRKGLNGEAETAFSHALALDELDGTALSNLARLYAETGREAQAKKLDRIVKTRQQKNPFWHYGQARIAYEEGRFLNALESIHSAIRLDGSQYRFYAFAAIVYRRLGNTDKYNEYGIKASKLKLSADL